jgi:hypothetical protein
MRRAHLLGTLSAAVAIEVLMTGFTVLFPAEGGAYGGPLPVGSWRGSIFLGGAAAGIDPWPALIVNVLATTVILWVVVRSHGGVLLPFVGALAFFVVAVVMYIGLRAGLPFAGVPIPIALRDDFVAYPPVQLIALWVDCLVGAAVFVMPSFLRARLAAPERIPSSDR